MRSLMTISLETLCVLKWVLKHNSEGVRKLILKALKNKATNPFNSKNYNARTSDLKDVQKCLIEFITFLDKTVLDQVFSNENIPASLTPFKILKNWRPSKSDASA